MSTLTLLFAWFLTMLPGNFDAPCQGPGAHQPCPAAPPAEEEAQQESSLFGHLWSVRPNGISNGV